MDGLGGVMGGATEVAPAVPENANEVTAAEPVQPAEASAPVVEAAVPGIPIERVKEVVEMDRTPLEEAAPFGRSPGGRQYGMVRQNKLENSPYFEQVKQQYQSGTNSARIAAQLFEQKAFPDLTYHGIRSMVDRSLMRAGLMKSTSVLGGFTRPKKPAKPSRAVFASSVGKMFSTHQLAKRYKVSESSIRSWVKRGVMNLKEVGATSRDGRNHWYFPLAAIEQWERKQETFRKITALREFVTRQTGAEKYLSFEQAGARYGITGSGVHNWVKREVLKEREILASGGFKGEGRALFIPESYLLRWEKTPRAQALTSVRATHPSVAGRANQLVRAVAAERDEKVLDLNQVGARYGVTDGSVYWWMQKGFLKGARQFYSAGSRKWRIPLSWIVRWEDTPEARRVALSIPTLQRLFAKRLVASAPSPGIARPTATSSKEIDVAAIARATGVPTQDIRKVLEKVGIQSKALKISQSAIAEIERILTAGGEARVKKGNTSEFLVEAIG